MQNTEKETPKKRTSPIAKVGKRRVLLIQSNSIKPARSVNRVRSIIPARVASNKKLNDESQ